MQIVDFAEHVKHKSKELIEVALILFMGCCSISLQDSIMKDLYKSEVVKDTINIQEKVLEGDIKSAKTTREKQKQIVKYNEFNKKLKVYGVKVKDSGSKRRVTLDCRYSLEMYGGELKDKLFISKNIKEIENIINKREAFERDLKSMGLKIDETSENGSIVIVLKGF